MSLEQSQQAVPLGLGCRNSGTALIGSSAPALQQTCLREFESDEVR